MKAGIRLATAATLLAAAVLATGCVTTGNVAGVSGTCTQPATLNDGFFANRAVFFRVATQADPLDPRTTWICLRAKAPGQPELAWRIDANPTTEVPGVRVTNDTSSRACTTEPHNILGPPHPIEQGEVLETPFYLDAWAAVDRDDWDSDGFADGGVWLCVEAGPVKQRVAVDLGRTNDPDIGVLTDTAPPAPQDLRRRGRAGQRPPQRARPVPLHGEAGQRRGPRLRASDESAALRRRAPAGQGGGGPDRRRPAVR
jgi:hypothetical protein